MPSRARLTAEDRDAVYKWLGKAIRRNLLTEDPNAPLAACITPGELYEIFCARRGATVIRKSVLTQFTARVYPIAHSNGSRFTGLTKGKKQSNLNHSVCAGFPDINSGLW